MLHTEIKKNRNSFYFFVNNCFPFVKAVNFIFILQWKTYGKVL